ncbi:hypothetical protein EW146_g3694 [Bondarzewia mesenterica]|uniref:Uncharacterized protein n=1 Tax=Bondarzewia mesenterica TaxID=1095465 RepID=A0A4S4LY88_9AGAM|nr:hypothetical protein EW146_g3694 [Bondarzewia mesenterica]
MLAAVVQHMFLLKQTAPCTQMPLIRLISARLVAIPGKVILHAKLLISLILITCVKKRHPLIPIAVAFIPSASPSQSQRTSASHNASSPSPMSSFWSLIAHRANAAATSNVQNQKMASARCNLPQHCGRGSAGTSLSLREQFRVSSEEQCMFAILPYVVKDGNNQYQMRGHASPEYSFAHDKLSDLLRILNKHHLGFSCSLPKAGQVWTHLDHFFQDHCNDHGHIVPDAPPRSSNEVISDDMDSATHFSMLKWLLLMPKRIQSGSVYHFELASQIIWHSFTLDTLVKECGPKKLKNPLHDTWPLFILAPHYGNLRSGISEFFSPAD